uniref:Uncharacterized protein n=1 Tax=Chrysotila carterae TaxID=13221 RepID=A0A7S4BXZ6_CHRCT
MRNEVELSGWGSTFRIGRTGNQYIAGFNALGLAACCAAVAKLPANHFAPQLPFPRRTRFDFTHLAPAENVSMCLRVPVRKHAEYFWPIGEGQQFRACAPHKLRAARDAMREYAAYDQTRCPASVLVGARTVPLAHTLVMHVRSGDIFPRPGGAAMYQPPPLSFYLDAWQKSNCTFAVVLSEDDANPCIPRFRALQTRTANVAVFTHRSWLEDLQLLLCAPQLALSHTSLRHWFEDQPRRALFSHQFSNAVDGALVLGRPAHVRDWWVWRDRVARGRWLASPQQLEALVAPADARGPDWAQVPKLRGQCSTVGADADNFVRSVYM